MRIIGIALSAISLGAGATHCSTAQAVPRPRPPQTIYISVAYTAPFEAHPGDTVNVIMEPNAVDPQGYCDHRGGALWINPYTGIQICEHIDF